MSYADWKATVMKGVPLDIDGSGDFDCVDIPKSWAMYLFPAVSWIKSIGYGDAKDLFNGANTQYFEKYRNNGGPNPDIEIRQGDIAVYGPTPVNNYTNKYNNPYGHVGVVDMTYAGGVILLQQESNTGRAPYLTRRDFVYAPLIGILRPRKGAQPVNREQIDQLWFAHYGGMEGQPNKEQFVGKPFDEVLKFLVNSDARKRHIDEINLWYNNYLTNKPATQEDLDILWFMSYGGIANQPDNKKFINKPLHDVINFLDNSELRRQRVAEINEQYNAFKSNPYRNAIARIKEVVKDIE